MTRARTKQDAAPLFEAGGAEAKVAEKPAPAPEVKMESPASKGQVAVTQKRAVPPRAHKQALPAQATPADSLARVMETIERLAVNPAVGADKIGLLLDAQERILDRNARMAFDAALVEMQPRLPVIEKRGLIEVREKTATGKRDGEVQQSTRFAKWEDVQEGIYPVLHQYGFSLTHRIGTVVEAGSERRVRCTAVLKGHGFTDDSCYFDLGADTGGNKSNNQGWASSVSFAKRHTAFAVLGIIAKGEDDDGKGPPAMIGTPMNEEQVAQLVELSEAVGCPRPNLIKHLNETRPKKHPEAKTLENVPAERFDEVVAALRSYEANKKANAGESRG